MTIIISRVTNRLVTVHIKLIRWGLFEMLCHCAHYQLCEFQYNDWADQLK